MQQPKPEDTAKEAGEGQKAFNFKTKSGEQWSESRVGNSGPRIVIETFSGRWRGIEGQLFNAKDLEYPKIYDHVIFFPPWCLFLVNNVICLTSLAASPHFITCDINLDWIRKSTN